MWRVWFFVVLLFCSVWLGFSQMKDLKWVAAHLLRFQIQM
jgi:hypothetical protein